MGKQLEQTEKTQSSGRSIERGRVEGISWTRNQSTGQVRASSFDQACIWEVSACSLTLEEWVGKDRSRPEVLTILKTEAPQMELDLR